MIEADRDDMVEPQQMMTAPHHQQFTIGLPANNSEMERRFPLTPEGVALLVEAGFRIKIQQDAGRTIHYSDTQYMRAGAEITTRDSALACDIVLHLAPPQAVDVRKMKRGALLLSLFQPDHQPPEAITEMLRRRVTAIAIDLVVDKSGHTPFADILAEIDGRAAMALCSSLLARPDHGKGILLGGVAGIIPCEVTIIGSGISARAAAMSATGLGAMVRMLDNDIYSLREAARYTGPGTVQSAIHPHVLENALRSADVVITAGPASGFTVGSELVDVMKKGVIIMDIDYDRSPSFPSLPAVDVVSPGNRATAGRVCYKGIGNVVPRTAAMALSNSLLPLLKRMAGHDSTIDSVRLIPELHKAVCTFIGHAVNRRIAELAGVRPVDINFLLNCC